jgi:hypothetical protein
MRPPVEFVALLLWLVALAPIARAQPELHKGDLLVADDSAPRVLHVDPQTGAVQVFTPRAAGTNLLQTVEGVATDPNGAIFLTDSQAQRVFSVDPATGVQSVLKASSGNDVLGPVDVGAFPRGLAIASYDGGIFDSRDLYIAAPGRIYRVSRALLSVGSSIHVDDPLLDDNYNGIAVREEGSTVAEIFVVGHGGLVRWRESTGSVSTINSSSELLGVAYSPEIPDRVFVAQQIDCGQGNPGSAVFAHPLSGGPIIPISSGGLLQCPTGLAIASANLIYVLDSGPTGDPERIVKLAYDGAAWNQSVAATLPAGSYFRMAVSTIPEPEAATAGMLALVVLAAGTRCAGPRRV